MISAIVKMAQAREPPTDEPKRRFSLVAFAPYSLPKRAVLAQAGMSRKMILCQVIKLFSLE